MTSLRIAYGCCTRYLPSSKLLRGKFHHYRCSNTYPASSVCNREKNLVFKLNSKLRNQQFSSEKVASAQEKSSAKDKATSNDGKLSKKAQLVKAVKDYGTTVIVFHVGISLASLGACYVAVSNGLDVGATLQFIGFSEATVSSKLATEGSTMIIAYAVHKVFAPVRIGMTLTATPFIVKYLRRKGFLKDPANPN